MDTLPYSISVYGPTTLLNGLEEKMSSPKTYSRRERNDCIKETEKREGVKITNCVHFGYNSSVQPPLFYINVDVERNNGEIHDSCKCMYVGVPGTLWWYIVVTKQQMIRRFRCYYRVDGRVGLHQCFQ